MPHPTRNTPRPRQRRGFTIVELLGVILIIGILVTLVTVASQGAIRAAREAEVVADIQGLEAGISDFKVVYGTEPPSSITLVEDGASWGADAKRKLRKIFGNTFDFSQTYDFDNDSAFTGTFTLNGAECLAFFLCGPPVKVDGEFVSVGFSKNPKAPFNYNSASPGNRVGPFLDVDNSRLRNSVGNAAFPEYHDTLPGQTAPYAYAHSDEYASGMNVWTQAGGSFWNPKSYQITSPGFDGQYGNGGVYSQDDDSVLAEAERDNITNFSGGSFAD